MPSLRPVSIAGQPAPGGGACPATCAAPAGRLPPAAACQQPTVKHEGHTREEPPGSCNSGAYLASPPSYSATDCLWCSARRCTAPAASSSAEDLRQRGPPLVHHADHSSYGALNKGANALGASGPRIHRAHEGRHSKCSTCAAWRRVRRGRLVVCQERGDRRRRRLPAARRAPPPLGLVLDEAARAHPALEPPLRLATDGAVIWTHTSRFVWETTNGL
jgi:hypothetical protein